MIHPVRLTSNDVRFECRAASASVGARLPTGILSALSKQSPRRKNTSTGFEACGRVWNSQRHSGDAHAEAGFAVACILRALAGPGGARGDLKRAGIPGLRAAPTEPHHTKQWV
ncbi:MAG: hypothetical protein AAF636_01985 [Pseudomonadota bacterium]